MGRCLPFVAEICGLRAALLGLSSEGLGFKGIKVNKIGVLGFGGFRGFGLRDLVL